MTHPRSATTTVVAILGADALAENILARLLEGEGYATRVLKTFLMGEPLIEEEMPVGGVDLVVLAPSLSHQRVRSRRPDACVQPWQQQGGILRSVYHSDEYYRRRASDRRPTAKGV
jgi:hypothetical protein